MAVLSLVQEEGGTILFSGIPKAVTWVVAVPTGPSFLPSAAPCSLELRRLLLSLTLIIVVGAVRRISKT